MEKFEFFVDELRPQWWRYNLEVEANSKEEAIQKALNFDGEILDSELISDRGNAQVTEVRDLNFKLLIKT